MRFPRVALTGFSALAALVAISSVLAQSAPHKVGADKPMGDYLDMQAQSAPFRAYADQWIALARTGDVPALQRTISPNMAGRVGADAIRRNLDAKVAPFFTQAKEIGKSVTVAETTDAFGSRGYVYYMYIVAKTGERRPFVVYVVNENGRTVVANVLTDHLVPDRHK
jgi:hypothetical protein